LDAALPKARRRTAQRLFEGLQAEGYYGAYDSVQRHVKTWKAASSGRGTVTQAFVPLSFAPGEVGQFNWSCEHVVLGGVTQTIKLAHFRLAHNRAMFVVAYPRETQEMVHDNLKTVVDAVFSGKERQFNRLFWRWLITTCSSRWPVRLPRAGTKARSRIRWAISGTVHYCQATSPPAQGGSGQRYDYPARAGGR
jgi:hypothetical protein